MVFIRQTLLHGVLISVLAAHLLVAVEGYASSPKINRRAMAGLWRLTGKQSLVLPVEEEETATVAQYPMKEFTVYPKKQNHSQPSKARKDLLLMLQEDGSFRQYGDRTELEEERDKLRKKIGTKAEQEELRGTWDYLDGKLILAADRPPNAKDRHVHDTILVGRVVATSEESLADHPVTPKEEEKPQQEQEHVDTHLSVPKGSVKVGRFIYPKTHPSFFEQPMFQPEPKGSFELRQVLGSLNTQTPQEEEEIVEKFSKDVFLGKKFFLTSHPLEKKRRKGPTRWSIKYNKFVEDPPKHQSKREEEAEKNAPIPIRVLELAFFANNTFTTLAGLGTSTVLRGKWDVIGKQKDQLWMQVWRFGFGRSVSGSTFSEGMGLTQNDEKAYWGLIDYEKDEKETDGDEEVSENGPKAETTESREREPADNENKRIEVKGSVLDGWGLEPVSVARFIMREATEEELLAEEEEEDDDDDVDERLDRLFSQKDDDDEDLDWSNAFQ